MRLTKDVVITAAAEIADKEGLDHVTLKALAEKLNIRTPSLYNHIDSLEDLLRDIAHKGMREMNAEMTQAAIGTSGDAAIKAVSVAYFRFLVAHPGVYETIQWAGWHGNAETGENFENYRSLLETLIISCNLKNPDTDAVLDLLTGFLHGYGTLQLGKALADQDEAVRGLITAVDTLLLGIRGKYG